MSHEIQLQLQLFEEDYDQMLRDMFDWPFEDYPNIPDDYTPIEIPPEPTPRRAQRSHKLKIATWGSNDGRKLITEMDDNHLANTIAFFDRTQYPNHREYRILMLEEQECRSYEQA